MVSPRHEGDVRPAHTATALPSSGVVVDRFFGTEVVDPFRWLEDGDSDRVEAWTDMQNARTRAVLDMIPGRDALGARLRELLEVGVLSAPTMRVTGSGRLRLFYFQRKGDQDQGVFYFRDGLSGRDRALIDVAAMSSDAPVALAWTSPSPDGALVAWGRSEGGSEESTLQVRDVASGKDLSDVISGTRFASIAWRPDSGGFYYTRYPEPGTVPEGDQHYHRKVFFHELSSDPRADPLVFPDARARRVREKTESPSVSLSPDGRWLVVRVHRGARRSEIHVRDLDRDPQGTWIEVTSGINALFRPVPRNDRLYLVTDFGAPRSRLLAVDYDRPEPNAWREIIPEAADDVLRSVTVGSRVIVANYLHDAATRLQRFDLDGTPLGPIVLPTIGSATVRGRHDRTEAFVHFTSFVVPGEVLHVDLETGESTTWGRVGETLGLDHVSITQATATSRDGTRVPMYVVAPRWVTGAGPAPLILTGYGGFNQCASPAFSTRALAAVERGATWVQAVLRGGGEFGDEWHRAGILEHKQNVFDDFIACAEELVRGGVTSPSMLGILGSSNGGLLTAAVVTQRPHLFRAAVSDVPLTDMLRYHHFRGARLWASEYGTAEEPAQFRALLAYSPYHRVRDGELYPSMLFVTAENDTRVDPMHARKMTARMQVAQSGMARGRPILLRLERRAGHGAGKPIGKLADEFADELSFLLAALGCDLSAQERGDADATRLGMLSAARGAGRDDGDQGLRHGDP